MGFVEKLISWAGRHPYLSATGLFTILLGGGLALGQLYKSKDSDGTAASAAITIDSPTLAPTPAPTVAAKNGSAKETAPTKYVLKYYTPENKEIIITGNSVAFIKDTVETLEYGYKFSPVFKLRYSKDIGILSDKINGDMGGGDGGIDINASAMHQWIEKGLIETVVREVAHEEGHNYFTLNENDSSEGKADIFRNQVRESLRSVNKSEAKSFVENFDFSKWEKQIQVKN